MSYVYYRRGGIVVASQAADERSVAQALKRFDPDLVLSWELDYLGRRVYEVHKVVSKEQPAVLICRWTDDYGEPLPLSHGLVDLVAQHRRGGRLAAWEEEMRKKQEWDRKDVYEGALELAKDALPRIAQRRNSIPKPGVYLRRAHYKKWSEGKL